MEAIAMNPELIKELIDKPNKDKPKAVRDPKDIIAKIIRNSRVYDQGLLLTDENILKEFKSQLASIDLSIEFDFLSNSFIVNRIKGTKKHLKTNGDLKVQLEFLLNDTLKGTDIIKTLQDNSISEDETKEFLMIFYYWTKDLATIEALYSIFQYQSFHYYMKKLFKHNKEQAKKLNGGDIVKNYGKDVVVPILQKDIKNGIMKDKAVKTKKNIQLAMTDYKKKYEALNQPLICDTHTPEQQALTYRLLMLMNKYAIQDSEILYEYKKILNETERKFQKVNKKKDNSRLSYEKASYEFSITLSKSDMINNLGLSNIVNATGRAFYLVDILTNTIIKKVVKKQDVILEPNQSIQSRKEREYLLDRWLFETNSFLNKLDKKPFTIKETGDSKYPIKIIFIVNSNTINYLYNDIELLKNEPYTITQGLLQAYNSIDKMRASKVKTALYEAMNYYNWLLTYNNDRKDPNNNQRLQQNNIEQLKKMTNKLSKRLRKNDASQFKHLINNYATIINIVWYNNNLDQK